MNRFVILSLEQSADVITDKDWGPNLPRRKEKRNEPLAGWLGLDYCSAHIHLARRPISTYKPVVN